MKRVLFVCRQNKRRSPTVEQTFSRRLDGRTVICLDIPDRVAAMVPELIVLLPTRMARHLPVH